MLRLSIRGIRGIRGIAKTIQRPHACKKEKLDGNFHSLGACELWMFPGCLSKFFSLV
jgi:hypothetical protein